MRQPEFIGGTAATVTLSFARTVCAQTNQSIQQKRIAKSTEKPEGMTISGRRTFKAYFGELNRLGDVEGKNLIVERYSPLGRTERYGDVARAIVASHPDLIVSLGASLPAS
jgi:putative ABC transport system substrate-binding protein